MRPHDRDRVWDRLLAFALAGEDDLSREEVQDRLHALGVSTASAMLQVKLALQAAEVRSSPPNAVAEAH